MCHAIMLIVNFLKFSIILYSIVTVHVMPVCYNINYTYKLFTDDFSLLPSFDLGEVVIMDSSSSIMIWSSVGGMTPLRLKKYIIQSFHLSLFVQKKCYSNDRTVKKDYLL